MPFSSHCESKLHPRQLKESIWSQNELGRIPLVKIYHTFDTSSTSSSLTPYRYEEELVCCKPDEHVRVVVADVSELSFFMLSRGIFLRVHCEFFQAALERSYGKTANSPGDRRDC